MFKVCVLIALAIVGASAQEPLEGPNAAPEPYSYGYQTDTHAAAEQKDPNGRVSGYYTLADADGRERRVEYIADEAGFRAKVSTNELGTKQENSADVEVLAAPPTEAQLAPVAQKQAIAAPAAAAPARSAGYAYQPYGANYGYGYYPGAYGYGAGYGAGYGSGYASRYGAYGYAPGYAASNYGALYSSYNNHLPSQYYKSLGTAAAVQPAAATTGAPAAGLRYSAAPAGNYRLTNYQTYGPASGAGYGSGYGYGYAAAPGYGYGYGPAATRSSLAGSSNYLVLKKKRNSQ